MGIFSSIKDFIFGKHDAAHNAAPAPQPHATAPVAPAAAPATASIVMDKPPSQAQVNVAAILDSQAAHNSQTLNWRQSIVDLMKLCGMDSSLEHRKELARELGYTGDTNDSATMNVWLHKAVMQKLAESGGQVPPELKT